MSQVRASFLYETADLCWSAAHKTDEGPADRQLSSNLIDQVPRDATWTIPLKFLGTLDDLA
jgi:hypothetical protein